MVQPLAIRLASILRSANARAAGFLVAAGIRSMADDIAADLCPFGCTVNVHDRALAEIVRAWGAGHDTLAVDALATWGRRGCADCALRVLQGLPACADCAESA